MAYALRLGESGDFAAAIGMLEEATRIKANAHTWDLLGQACLRAGRPTSLVSPCALRAHSSLTSLVCYGVLGSRDGPRYWKLSF